MSIEEHTEEFEGRVCDKRGALMNQITAPIRLQALRRETEPIPRSARNVQGKRQQALITHNPYEPTLVLVKSLISRYSEKYGALPSVIDLCDMRYWTIKIMCYDYYYIKLADGSYERIPYQLQERAVFEVRVRGVAP